MPLYECELSSTVKVRVHSSAKFNSSLRAREMRTQMMRVPPCDSQKDESSHLHQFILHAALDMVEERLWDTSSCYLKARGVT